MTATTGKPVLARSYQLIPGRGCSPRVRAVPHAAPGPSVLPSALLPGTAQGCLPSGHRPLLDHPGEGPRGSGAVSESVQGLPVPRSLGRTSDIPPKLCAQGSPRECVRRQPSAYLHQHPDRCPRAAAAWCRPGSPPDGPIQSSRVGAGERVRVGCGQSPAVLQYPQEAPQDAPGLEQAPCSTSQGLLLTVPGGLWSETYSQQDFSLSTPGSSSRGRPRV